MLNDTQKIPHANITHRQPWPLQTGAVVVRFAHTAVRGEQQNRQFNTAYESIYVVHGGEKLVGAPNNQLPLFLPAGEIWVRHVRNDIRFNQPLPRDINSLADIVKTSLSNTPFPAQIAKLCDVVIDSNRTPRIPADLCYDNKNIVITIDTPEITAFAATFAVKEAHTWSTTSWTNNANQDKLTLWLRREIRRRLEINLCYPWMTQIVDAQNHTYIRETFMRGLLKYYEKIAPTPAQLTLVQQQITVIARNLKDQIALRTHYKLPQLTTAILSQRARALNLEDKILHDDKQLRDPLAKTQPFFSCKPFFPYSFIARVPFAALEHEWVLKLLHYRLPFGKSYGVPVCIYCQQNIDQLTNDHTSLDCPHKAIQAHADGKTWLLAQLKPIAPTQTHPAPNPSDDFDLAWQWRLAPDDKRPHTVATILFVAALKRNLTANYCNAFGRWSSRGSFQADFTLTLTIPPSQGSSTRYSGRPPGIENRVKVIWSCPGY